MDTKRNLERGQAIVLLAVTIVVLLGFTALAIDGGMVYADRRRAQNGADAAALAGALQRVNDASDAVVLEAITYSLQGNGYDMSNVRTNIHAGQDYSGEFFLITVEMTRTTRTSFLQVFYQGEMKNRDCHRTGSPQPAGYAGYGHRRHGQLPARWWLGHQR